MLKGTAWINIKSFVLLLKDKDTAQACLVQGVVSGAVEGQIDILLGYNITGNLNQKVQTWVEPVSWFSMKVTARDGHHPTTPGGFPFWSDNRQYSHLSRAYIIYSMWIRVSSTIYSWKTNNYGSRKMATVFKSIIVRNWVPSLKVEQY